jgi:hypothetical protein
MEIKRHNPCSSLRGAAPEGGEKCHVRHSPSPQVQYPSSIGSWSGLGIHTLCHKYRNLNVKGKLGKDG